MADKDPTTSVRLMTLVFVSALFAGPSLAAGTEKMPPWVGQKTESDCGRAVLASLLARKDGNVEAAYRRVPAPKDEEKGFSLDELLNLSPGLGITLTLRPAPGKTIAGQCALTPAKRAHLNALGRDADAGRPSVLPVSFSKLSGHYVLLVGTANNEFQVLDPASPGLKSYGVEELAKLMCGSAFLALEVRDKPTKRLPRKP